MTFVYATLFVLLAWRGLVDWRARRERAAAWFGLTFTCLAAATLLGELSTHADSAAWELRIARIDVVIIACIPYCLFRFKTEFHQAFESTRIYAVAITALVALGALVIPDPGPHPHGVLGTVVAGYLVLLAFQWMSLGGLVATRFLTGNQHRPFIVRKRLRLLGVATLLMQAALITSLVLADGAAQSVSGALAAVSALLFFAGYAPPKILRLLWRRDQQQQLHDATIKALAAESRSDVVDEMLPPLCATVGGHACVLTDARGAIVGRWARNPNTDWSWLEHDDAAPPAGPAPTRTWDIPAGGGCLRVAVSPYTPFFGQDEMALVRSAASTALVAIERAAVIEHLRSVDRIKTGLVSAVSHELRTPLTSILGFALTLQERNDDLDPAMRSQLIETLVEQAQRLDGLVTDLLDFNQLERGASSPRAQRVDVGQIATSVVERLQRARPDAENVEIVVDTDGTHIHVEPPRVERAIENLITNAIRHTPSDRGAVHVAVRAHDDGALVVVEDNGPGVPLEYRTVIFDAFERGPGDPDPAAPGLGIGLALVDQIAKLHGGRAWVEPAESGGASFRMYLADCAEAVPAPATSESV